MSEIDEIKQKIDIIDLIGQYVQLKKSGKNYKGLCPFHQEKTPSFMVNPELQIFKCFGCNEGGDIFSFIQKIEGYDFKQALEFLAEKAGVKLSNYKKSGNVENSKSILYEINEVAKKFYHFLLTKHKIGSKALEYLLEKRKLTRETIEYWGLGYAPNNFLTLKTFLLKKGYSESDMLKAGVISPTKYSQKYVDKFRGRVIFPLTGSDGKTLGFAGRTILNVDPKYLNTQETSIFHKESFLYGLDKTKLDIKAQGAIVVEGYLDLISAHQAGIKNVVATCGTALTLTHLTILSRYTKDISLCFDSDNAGKNATLRAIEIASSLKDLNVKVISLPNEFKDIDEMAKSNKDKLYELVNKAEPAYDFVIKLFEQENNISNPIGKKKFLENVAFYLSKCSNPVIKEHYAQELSKKTEVDYQIILSLINDKIENKEELTKNIININNAKSPQDYLLALIISQNDIDKFKEILQNLTPDDFLSNEESLELFRSLLEFANSSENKIVKNFIQGLSGKALAKAKELALWDIGDITTEETKVIEEAQKAAKRIKKEGLKRKMRLLTEQIKSAEKSGDLNEASKLTQKFKNMVKNLKNLDQT